MDWFDVAFGPAKAGLTSVHFRLYDATGSAVVARTSSGVVEVGNGAYGARVSVHASAVGIEWDTGEASAVYAHESLTIFQMQDTDRTRIRELYQIFGLEAGSPLQVTPSLRSVAGITQTISGVPDTSIIITRS
jgi:hypothetical protein